MEDLTTIYKRAMQYCSARFGGEPDELHLLEDGSFKVIYGGSNRGEYCEDERFFESGCLTQDLDSVYEDRKKAEAEQQEKDIAERKKREREQSAREKQQRKEQYEKLKKEFDN